MRPQVNQVPQNVWVTRSFGSGASAYCAYSGCSANGCEHDVEISEDRQIACYSVLYRLLYAVIARNENGLTEFISATTLADSVAWLPTRCRQRSSNSPKRAGSLASIRVANPRKLNV